MIKTLVIGVLWIWFPSASAVDLLNNVPQTSPTAAVFLPTTAPVFPPVSPSPAVLIPITAPVPPVKPIPPGAKCFVGEPKAPLTLVLRGITTTHIQENYQSTCLELPGAGAILACQEELACRYFLDVPSAGACGDKAHFEFSPGASNQILFILDGVKKWQRWDQYTQTCKQLAEWDGTSGLFTSEHKGHEAHCHLLSLNDEDFFANVTRHERLKDLVGKCAHEIPPTKAEGLCCSGTEAEYAKATERPLFGD